MLKLVITTLCIFITSHSIGFGQAITLESVEGSISGLIIGDTLPNEELITFNLRMTNDDTPKTGITNGFSISSNNGAIWNLVTADTLIGFRSNFDLIFEINNVSTGSGADTVGFGGSAAFMGGLPANFDEVCYAITIGPISRESGGRTIVLDSSFYQPAGVWKWAAPVQVPSWDGPHVFTVLDIIYESRNLTNWPSRINVFMQPDFSGTVTDSIVFFYTFPQSGVFYLSENISWLTLDTTEGMAPEYISYQITKPGGEGMYQDSILVTSLDSENTPYYIKVNLQVESTKGDFNLDNLVNMTDIIHFVEYSFLGGSPPANLETIDMNSDGNVDIEDLIQLVKHVFG